MKVLAISGSLRQGSYNTTVLRTAERLLPNDVQFELYDGLKWVPPYDEDDDGDDAPVEVQRLRAALAGADAVLISTPEYNSSVPGQLKNALDWASRPIATNVLRNFVRELSRERARSHQRVDRRVPSHCASLDRLCDAATPRRRRG